VPPDAPAGRLAALAEEAAEEVAAAAVVKVRQLT
jgi:hypothetical protein